MNKIEYSLIPFIAGWRWHLHLLAENEQRLQLLPALEARFPPQFWEGSEVIQMELVAMRAYASENPDLPNPHNEEMVPIQQTDGSEWRDILEWRAAGGLYKPIAGPPRSNTWMIRIVSPRLKAALEQFNLPPHRFYPVRVKHEFIGEEREYFMFHLLGDNFSGERAAYWPAMKFNVFEKESKNVVQEFPLDSAMNYDEFLKSFRSFFDEYDKKKISIDFPYYVYREPYDLVWAEGDMGMTKKMGEYLFDEFGWEVSGRYSGKKPIITGFDPERDSLPPEFLEM